MPSQVNPTAIVVGQVREVSAKTFLNPETGEIEARGRTVLVLTEKGFLKLTVPTEFNSVAFTDGEDVAVYMRIAEWSVNGRSGVSFFFEGYLDEQRAKAVLAPHPVKAAS